MSKMWDNVDAMGQGHVDVNTIPIPVHCRLHPGSGSTVTVPPRPTLDLHQPKCAICTRHHTTHRPYSTTLFSRNLIHYINMGVWQAALVKIGMAQPGPKITAQDRAVLE
jgi:hypothetical protein